MSFDDLLALAGQDEPTQLERARARRALLRVEQEHARRAAEGPEVTCDVELRAPFASGIDEITRITRAAQLAKLGTITWDARRRRLSWSDEMSMVFGQPPGLVRPSMTRLFALIHPDDRVAVRRQIHRAWRDQTVTEVTYRVVRADASTGYVHCYLEVLVDEHGSLYGLIATGQDVTELELARQERDRLARRCQSVRTDLLDRDPVTGFLTRARFADEIDRAQRTGTGTLLVVVAPPLTRRGNDSGPAGDDQLATATAEVLRKLVRPADACGLVGRHEFGVLMQYTTIDTAVPIAEEILDGLRAPRFMAAPAQLQVHGGLVRYDCRTMIGSLDLLIDAEAAWRRAKRRQEPLHALRQTPSAEERQETCRARVRAAVARNRFVLYTQPLRNLELNRITRHEILLRVLDDAGNALPPSIFLDIAEHVDEILSVDTWVIENAMRLIGRGPQTSHYQINISGRSITDPELLDHVRHAVRRNKVNPECVTFEITETALIGNLTEARRFADGVRELGCQLALDDFGTGYTSYAYLKYFPIDMVKIDGDFIHDLPNSPADQAIVRSLVQVCRVLGIRTAAEYVQDHATCELLRTYGVDFAQGYYIGKPEPVATTVCPSDPTELGWDAPRPRPRAAMG
ncbi:MAG: EAL domain-containing protein [Dactylosporangium sp.]|nr:EAL domain-containing protein [Dactylosporangium sp.]NNJ63804.1 EAL domain-containing protein [Dactylosporangium sp.]